MALFKFGKQTEEETVPACACSCGCGTEQKEAESASCGCGCSTRSADETENKCRTESGGTENGRDEPNGEIRSITVLGAGCKSCHALYENTKEAAQKLGISVEVEYVTDLQKVMEYGVMSMPALVVNEKVVAMGKVLKAADVERLLHTAKF